MTYEAIITTNKWYRIIKTALSNKGKGPWDQYGSGGAEAESLAYTKCRRIRTRYHERFQSSLR